MKKKVIAKFIYFLIAIIFLSACGKDKKKVTFENVCQAENHSIVEIKGFLHLPNSTTPDLTSNQLLLVENSNGTGGFIGVLANGTNLLKAEKSVKITGEILKEKNSCVLKIEKIETP
jgi:hypothetical protein